MLPGKIENHTAKFGPPKELTEKECGTLFIREEMIDGLLFKRSAWYPTPAELAAINAGAPIILGISTRASHPVVHLVAGRIPTEDLPDAGSDEITFAKVGGPPDDWANLRIIDLATNEEFIGSAIEIDTKAGYVIAYRMDANGNPMHERGKALTVKINGRYRLERRK